MFCSNCGKKCGTEDNFCAGCGTALKKPGVNELKTSDAISQDNAVPEVNKKSVTKKQAQQLRSIFNSLGYKHPSNDVSLDYNKFLESVQVPIMDPDLESVIIHIPIRASELHSIEAGVFGVRYKEDNRKEYVETGQLIITNLRLIVLEGLGRRQKPSGKEHHFCNFKYVEHAEYEDHTQFTLYGKSEYDVDMKMVFYSFKAALGRLSQMIGALGSPKGESMVEYLERRNREQSTQGYIDTHLVRAESLKQAYIHLLTVLTGDEF
jgi:hypothetical protein